MKRRYMDGFAVIVILIVLVIVALLTLKNWDSIVTKETSHPTDSTTVEHFKSDVIQMEKSMQDKLDKGLEQTRPVDQ